MFGTDPNDNKHDKNRSCVLLLVVLEAATVLKRSKLVRVRTGPCMSDKLFWFVCSLADTLREIRH